MIRNGDAFVHAGGCVAAELAELAMAADWIRALPHRRKVVVAGNNDWALAKESDCERAIQFFAEMDYLEDEGSKICSPYLGTSVKTAVRGGWDATWIVDCTTWECERAPAVMNMEIDSIRIEAPAPLER